MNNIRMLSIIFLGLSLPPIAVPQEKKIELSKDPLTAEQVQIYRVILEHYTQNSDASLNIAVKTQAFDLTDSFVGLKAGEGCLKEIELANLKQTATTVHKLDARVLVGKRMVLVDPEEQSALVRKNDPSNTIQGGKKVDEAVEQAFKSGLFSLSEIAFDKQHEWAVLSYSFYCGGLCGHGATVVLKKDKDTQEWKMTTRRCSDWIS
ncbi:MAG: hypothetical protein LAP21_19890 [Acidobacteriia bacterium]|nr:hypothetical protein [Terriglobia bacterium]